jgi:outer membrane protein OmpA-like peptidoglycan-associated protein
MKPYRIVVEGHTDKTGSVAANTRLSHQRAEAVARYLSMKTGLPFRSFTIKGVGSAQPIVEGDDPAMMAKNRRVEIWFELRGL